MTICINSYKVCIQDTDPYIIGPDVKPQMEFKTLCLLHYIKDTHVD